MTPGSSDSPAGHQGVMYAVLAALLFGASTPLAKILVGQVAPLTLAALFYLGSGVGLLACFLVRALFIRRRRQDQSVALGASDLPWLAAAIAAGGVAGPVLLMLGLAAMPASSASLLLNMEGVLTAVFAWCVFKENVDRRIALGMLFIVVAGVLLTWEQIPVFGVPRGALAILGACLCWAIDNNLTRKVCASDPLQIAGIKGLVAGAINLGIAFMLGLSLPPAPTILVAALLGFCGVGLSLVLFVLALRHLGTARTGAWFSVAPFVGAALSLLLPGEAAGSTFWLAATLMGAGLWLHWTESHAHAHQHTAMVHAHEHVHDIHHLHQHDFAWDGREPHAHFHRHAPLRHAHAHYPDMHHRHAH